MTTTTNASHGLGCAPARDCTVLTTWAEFSFDVRPASPEDEAILADFFSRLAPEDRRFRFLSGIANVDHDMLERLTRVDHDRTEDFLAFDRNRLIASAMLAGDPGRDRAEVAIAILPEYKHRGIGWTLLEHVARYAREKGIRSIESVECRDNVEAIGIEKEMGFTVAPYPGDATLVLLQKSLT